MSFIIKTIFNTPTKKFKFNTRTSVVLPCIKVKGKSYDRTILTDSQMHELIRVPSFPGFLIDTGIPI